MQLILLNCLTPLAVIMALAALALLSMRRWPALWPEPMLEAGYSAETWSLSQLERAMIWLRPQPDEPLDAFQRRIRRAADDVVRWSDQPRNALTLYVAAGALLVTLFGLIGLSQRADGLWYRASIPMMAAAAAVFVLDLLNRRRSAMLEKDNILRAMGSRSNHIALDAARTVVAQNWHRDGSLMSASFEHAGLRNLAMARGRLRGVSFMYADLAGADLMFADLSGGRLGSVDLRRASLNFSNLDNASLAMADLGGASLGRCSLRGAHLEGANLCGTFLDQSDLSGAHLEQAIYNGKTVWPSGFVPPEGAVNWDRLNDTERAWFRQWRWYVE